MPASKRLPFFILALFLGLLIVQIACQQSASAPALATQAAPVSTESSIPSVPLPPAVPETRMLTLEFPPAIRAGDSDIIRLTLEVDAQGRLRVTATASSAGNATRGQIVSIPNVYDTHNVLAEARLDMAGLEIRPAEAVSQPLLPGQSVAFFWSVRPADVGKYRGTLWLFLRFVPKDGGPEKRQALSAQVVEIESTSLFGLQAGTARWLGVAGTFISSVLGLPFLEEAIKWLWKRFKK